MTRVADGIDRHTMGIVNWYSVEENGKLTIVDAGTPADWALLVTALGERGRSLSDVETVLLTHAHGDHTGFAERLRQEAGATVRVHVGDEVQAKTGKVGGRDGSVLAHLLHAEAYRTVFGLARRRALRIVPIKELSSFEDGEVLDVPGRPRVVHSPGHTSGSSALWFERHSTVCTGDSLVTRNPLSGRVGPQVMPSAFNADTAAALGSLSALGGIAAELVLPGHGEPWSDGIALAVERARAAGRS